MADVKISALPAAATPLTGSEVLPIVQSGTTDQVSVANLTAGRTVAAAAFTATGGVSGTTLTVGAGSASVPSVTFTGNTNTGIYSPAADTIAFTEGGVEAMRLDSSGNMLLGATTARTIAGQVPAFLTERAAATATAVVRNTADANGPFILTAKSRGATNGSFALVASDDALGTWTFAGSDGTADIPAAQIQAAVDGTPGANDMPGRLVFSTTADGASSPTERMRITNSGLVGIGTATPGRRLTVSGAGVVAGFNSTNNVNVVVISNADVAGGFIGANGTNLTLANNTGVEAMRVTSSGEIYIAGTTDQGAYNLQVNGTGVWGAGAYVNGSDARIKDDIAPLASGLDVVAKLKPVQFRYKESWSKDTALQPGFIAQDLQAAMADQPYLDGVVLQGPEYMSVSYQALIPLLTKAIQEQQAQIEDLKTRVAALENK